MICKHCQSDKIYEELVHPDEGIPHYARQICSNCSRFLGWAKKPESKSRPADHTDLKHKYDRGYCLICMRPSRGLMMTAHHIVEYQHGGGSTEDNIMVVCSQCHGVIHHIRKYCPQVRV